MGEEEWVGVSGEWEEEKNEGEKRGRGGFEKWEDRTSLLPGRYRHRPRRVVYIQGFFQDYIIVDHDHYKRSF
jgi:hypothetical protein